MDVHALDAARTVIRPLESIAADPSSRQCASDESRSAAGICEHDVHVHRGRESRHAAAMNWAALELVLDVEDAVVRRSRCSLDAERSLGAAAE